MKRHIILISIVAGMMLFSSCKNRTDILFHNTQNKAVLKYAESELNNFLNQDIMDQASDKGIEHIEFTFQIIPNFEEAAFEVDSKVKNHELKVQLLGKTPSDVLYAAYTFLEKGGYLFDITGPIKPTTFDWESLQNYAKKIIPVVKKRGIRQHINFPMDVSSWSLSEAKLYIQNLSRMRFNYMTFHSYPGQWYEIEREDTTEYAGHFFYGDVHLVPEKKEIKAIVGNKRFFCIPEIEAVFEDKVAKSQKAVTWLQDVISESKRTGMQVQLSFEPRSSNTEIQKTVETVKAIVKQYPMIDALELITEESGGWGPKTTEEKTLKMLNDHFGDDFLNDSILLKPIKKKQSDLAYIYGQIGHNKKVIDYLKANQLVDEHISLKFGIYAVKPEYARPAYYLNRKISPETEIAILPGHHSQRVDQNLPKILLNKSDWDKAIIYSWIELDGMMYIQQNGISGIQNTVRQAMEKSSNKRANAILFNHWRTAENKVTARYAAEASLYGPIDVHQFYQDYAGKYGITPTTDFSMAMQLLDKADLTSMKNLSGFGFCWKGRWRSGGPLSNYPIESLQEVKLVYQKVLDQLKTCSNETSSSTGHSLLALLDNRIRTTIIYISAFEKARELKQFNTKNPLNKKDKTEYVRICNETIALFDQYINLYAQINADRGCAGNLVSFWHGPMNGIKVYREKHGGIPINEEIPLETAIDAPPLPIINTNEIN